MSFYSFAKRFMGLKSKRMKLLSLAGAHIAGMRYIGIFLDPVIACNIRCKMCYFADDKSRPALSGPISESRLGKIEKSLYRRAIKLQIGCGAEPTLYKDLKGMIKNAKDAGIPYIEMTTNGQLIDFDTLKQLSDAGLDGITLSLHGTTPETYEFFMQHAKYANLIRLIDALRKLKSIRPDFTLRINYTFNNVNIAELHQIWDLFNGVDINVLQIRPIQDMGSSQFTDFDMSTIIRDYDTLIRPLADRCKEEDTMFIGPSKENLMHVDKQQNAYDSLIEEVTYCYVSPTACYHEDFDIEEDTFKSYHKRNHTLRKLIKTALSPKKKADTKANKSKKLNYKIS